MKEYKVIVETITGINVKAETRQDAEKRALKELSTDPNIVSKQIVSVKRIRQNKIDNVTK